MLAGNIEIETQSHYNNHVHEVVKARTGMSPENENIPKPRQTEPPTVPFEQIAQGSNEILITYDGQIYRLRRTRNNRLILTK